MPEGGSGSAGPPTDGSDDCVPGDASKKASARLQMWREQPLGSPGGAWVQRFTGSLREDFGNDLCEFGVPEQADKKGRAANVSRQYKSSVYEWNKAPLACDARKDGTESLAVDARDDGMDTHRTSPGSARDNDTIYGRGDNVITGVGDDESRAGVPGNVLTAGVDCICQIELNEDKSLTGVTLVGDGSAGASSGINDETAGVATGVKDKAVGAVGVKGGSTGVSWVGVGAGAVGVEGEAGATVVQDEAAAGATGVEGKAGATVVDGDSIKDKGSGCVENEATELAGVKHDASHVGARAADIADESGTAGVADESAGAACVDKERAGANGDENEIAEAAGIKDEVARATGDHGEGGPDNGSKGDREMIPGFDDESIAINGLIAGVIWDTKRIEQFENGETNGVAAGEAVDEKGTHDGEADGVAAGEAKEANGVVAGEAN